MICISEKDRPALLQQGAQHGSVASVFPVTVAANGEVGARGKRCQECQGATRGRFTHLRAEASREFVPLGLGTAGLRFRHERRHRGQFRIPHVIPVVPRVAILAHSTRRPADSADANALVWTSRCAQLDNRDRQVLTP